MQYKPHDHLSNFVSMQIVVVAEAFVEDPTIISGSKAKMEIQNNVALKFLIQD